VLKDQAFGHEHKDRRARGVVLGRQEGQRASDKRAKEVLVQHKETTPVAGKRESLQPAGMVAKAQAPVSMRTTSPRQLSGELET